MVNLRWLRGWIVRAMQSRVTQPCRRRFPFSVYQRVHAMLRSINPCRFTDANPFKVVTVDPNKITESIVEHSPKYPQWGQVIDGEWDQQSRPFSDQPVVQGLLEHFEYGQPWKETQLYQAFCDQLDRFGNAWGYTSVSDFERRCQEIEQLYEQIKCDGYRSQTELRQLGLQATPVLDEVNVDLGRDGELLWRSYGQHRLAIAQMLDVPEIPIFVHRRHREWQNKRESIKCRPNESGVAAHPDLRDITSANS